jgi:O-antigen/teichoic acid export membrane protein
VRIVLGPEAVTVFNTVRKLSRTVNQVLNMIVHSIFPEFQYEIAQGNIKKSHKLFRVSIIIVFFTALVGTFFLSVFGLWFYEIWTSSTIEVPPLMWNVFIVSILFNSLWWASTMVYSALDKPYYFALSGVLAAAVSVVSSYFLAQFFGLNGVAIGSLSLDLILSFLMLPYACKLLKIKKSELIVEGFKDFKNMAAQVFVKISKAKHAKRNESVDNQKIENQSTGRSKTTNILKNKN